MKNDGEIKDKEKQIKTKWKRLKKKKENIVLGYNVMKSKVVSLTSLLKCFKT
jgi:flagellar capping protein FliD